MNRKQFIQLSLKYGALSWLFLNQFACSKTSGKANQQIKAIKEGSVLEPYGNKPIKKLVLSKEEWRKRLTSEQFYVLREEGTERPFTSPLNDEKQEGIYYCAGCDLDLFTSKMKYDSGTGWPSFFETIPGRFETKKDFKLIFPREEYHCIRCGGHQGHVFNDGPSPTYQRWCNNGVALKFQAEKIAT